MNNFTINPNLIEEEMKPFEKVLNCGCIDMGISNNKQAWWTTKLCDKHEADRKAKEIAQRRRTLEQEIEAIKYAEEVFCDKCGTFVAYGYLEEGSILYCNNCKNK